MDSKPLSSLYLCGTDSEENSFSGISGFDGIDVALPESMDYTNLRKNRLGNREANMFFPDGSSDQSLPSGSSGADSSRPNDVLLAAYDSSATFTSQDSSSNEPRMADSVLTGFAGASSSDSLPAGKLADADLANAVEDSRLSKSRVVPANDVGDLEFHNQRLSARSNSDCSAHDVMDVPCNTPTGYGVSMHGKKRSREDSNSGFLDGETSSNEDESDEVEDFHENTMMDEHNDAEKLNEDEEDVEEEGDDEEDDTEDEEEEEEEEEQEEESYMIDENVSEEQASKMDEEKQPDTEGLVESGGETSVSQQPDLLKMEEEVQSLPPAPERPKKPRKKKKVPTSTLL